MKFLISIAITLFAGIIIGLFLGSSDHESNSPVGNQVSSKSVTKHTNLHPQSEVAMKRFERELMENGIQTDGVFGKIAAQIQRYQTMSDSEFEAEVLYCMGGEKSTCRARIS